MYTGKYNSRKAGRFAAKRRISRRSILLTVSVLVLCLSMVGGTMAWLTTRTDPVENIFTVPGPGIKIEEEFDNKVKKDVGITNTGDIPLYVRLNLVCSYVDGEGNVYPKAPVAGESYTLVPGSSDWVQASDGTYYYTKPLAPGQRTSDAVESITPKYDSSLPEGVALDVHVLAQYVQAEGMKGSEHMVETLWPVTVQSDGSLALK